MDVLGAKQLTTNSIPSFVQSNGTTTSPESVRSLSFRKSDNAFGRAKLEVMGATDLVSPTTNSTMKMNE